MNSDGPPPSICVATFNCEWRLSRSPDAGIIRERMLEQQPASLHYLHYDVDTPEGPRRAVIVGWGMTEAESQQICQRLTADPGMKLEGMNKITCI